MTVTTSSSTAASASDRTEREVREVPDVAAAMRLDGRVALVTGASSGIGARAAKVLDSLGATVVVTARREARLTLLADELRDGHVVLGDLTEPGAPARVVAETLDRCGRIDVLISNAGVSTVVPALKESTASFEQTLLLDLVAPFELARTVASSMRDAGEGGSIVHVSSAAALRSSAGLPSAAYVAAKAGLVGLTRELALQWARYGIRVNAICPGMYPSEMTAGIAADAERRDAYAARIPLGRIAECDELDGILAFLATPASSYVTGQSLVIDGGAGL